MKRRVAILISGRGSNMAALIKAAQVDDYPAEIVVVISNRADALGLRYSSGPRIEGYNITNTPSFANPINTLGAPGFGSINSIGNCPFT